MFYDDRRRLRDSDVSIQMDKNNLIQFVGKLT